MKISRIIILLFAILLIFEGCTSQKIPLEPVRSSSSESKKEYYELSYVAPPLFQKLGDRELDVLKLKISGYTPILKDIGEVSRGRFRIDEDVLRYSDVRPEYYYDEETSINYETGRLSCSLPSNFWENAKESEGIIIFDGVPFSFFYNEDGEAYVRCLELRFDSYFKEDRSYVEFINFAINYEPKTYKTNEDTLSR